MHDKMKLNCFQAKQNSARLNVFLLSLKIKSQGSKVKYNHFYSTNLIEPNSGVAS